MKTRYIRLLSYDNARKVIDYVLSKEDDSYAYITVGGVGLQTENEQDIIDFIETFTNYYEITDLHPTKVKEQIIERLKL